MSADPHIVKSLQAEISDRALWQTRVVVLAFGVLSGLTVVAFTWMTEHALAFFTLGKESMAWLPLLWTPLSTAGVVWVTGRWVAGAAGSGIPQVMAALDPGVSGRWSGLFVSVRLTIAKMLLTTVGLLGGL